MKTKNQIQFIEIPEELNAIDMNMLRGGTTPISKGCVKCESSKCNVNSSDGETLEFPVC
ncbi:MAG: hypothetical protein LBH91_07625 [Prevotellaceae bacterium]|jgi:hypothetical protein|nr:hypothetical protein [Prevotellaceae bacterium]